MRARGIICCLCLSAGCLPAVAQQVLLSGVGSAAALETARPPAASSFPASLPVPAPPAVSYSASAALPEATSPELALPADVALADTFLTTSTAAYCTEALPPRLQALEYNAIEHLDLHPAALRAAFAHDNMVKMARNFVPGEPLPDAPSYVPLTSRQKWESFLRRSHSPDLAAGSLLDALYSQATGAYSSFGGGMPGFGKRLGASVAGAEAGAFFGRFLFPALFHQDTRYFRSTDTRTSDRLAYSASRAFITRSDDGRSVINTSVILSEFVQAAISNAYIPYRTETVPGTVENALAGIGSVAESNMLEEFWPDIKSFFGKHQPATIQRWHNRWNNSSFNQLASR